MTNMTQRQPLYRLPNGIHIDLSIVAAVEPQPAWATQFPDINRPPSVKILGYPEDSPYFGIGRHSQAWFVECFSEDEAQKLAHEIATAVNAAREAR